MNKLIKLGAVLFIIGALLVPFNFVSAVTYTTGEVGEDYAQKMYAGDINESWSFSYVRGLSTGTVTRDSGRPSVGWKWYSNPDERMFYMYRTLYAFTLPDLGVGDYFHSATLHLHIYSYTRAAGQPPPDFFLVGWADGDNDSSTYALSNRLFWDAPYDDVPMILGYSGGTSKWTAADDPLIALYPAAVDWLTENENTQIYIALVAMRDFDNLSPSWGSSEESTVTFEYDAELHYTYADEPATPTAPSGLAASWFLDTDPIDQYMPKLTWTDNSSNEYGFKIQRATNDTFTENLDEFLWPVADDEEWFDMFGWGVNVEIDDYLYYRVAAYNFNGDSSWSNTASIQVTDLVTGDPQAPTSLAVAFDQDEDDIGYMDLTWVHDTPAESWYHLQRASNDTFSQDVQNFDYTNVGEWLGIDKTNFRDYWYGRSDPAVDDYLYYRIRTYASISDSYSDWSNTASIQITQAHLDAYVDGVPLGDPDEGQIGGEIGGWFDNMGTTYGYLGLLGIWVLAIVILRQNLWVAAAIGVIATGWFVFEGYVDMWILLVLAIPIGVIIYRLTIGKATA